jgi:hypothetical protein
MAVQSTFPFFLAVKLRRWVDGFGRFEGTFCLHLQFARRLWTFKTVATFETFVIAQRRSAATHKTVPALKLTHRKQI